MAESSSKSCSDMEKYYEKIRLNVLFAKMSFHIATNL